MVEQKIQQLNKFKIERENTIQYPIKELLKDSINDWILSDIQQINMKLGQELRLISKVNNKDDIKRLKCFVKNNKSNLPSMLYDELKSEVKEIAEDFEWVRSKDGQIILEIEKLDRKGKVTPQRRISRYSHLHRTWLGKSHGTNHWRCRR